MTWREPLIVSVARTFVARQIIRGEIIMAKRNGHETVDHVQDPMVSGEPVAHVGDMVSGGFQSAPHVGLIGVDVGSGGDETAEVTTSNGEVVGIRKVREPLSKSEAVRLILTTLKRVPTSEQGKVLEAVSALR